MGARRLLLGAAIDLVDRRHDLRCRTGELLHRRRTVPRPSLRSARRSTIRLSRPDGLGHAGKRFGSDLPLPERLRLLTDRRLGLARRGRLLLRCRGHLFGPALRFGGSALHLHRLGQRAVAPSTIWRMPHARVQAFDDRGGGFRLGGGPLCRRTDRCTTLRSRSGSFRPGAGRPGHSSRRPRPAPALRRRPPRSRGHDRPPAPPRSPHSAPAGWSGRRYWPTLRVMSPISWARRSSSAITAPRPVAAAFCLDRRCRRRDLCRGLGEHRLNSFRPAPRWFRHGHGPRQG